MRLRSFSIAAVAGVILTSTVAWGGEAAGPLQPIKRQDRTLETSKHKIIVADTGFPQQVFVKPDLRDAPLEARANLPPVEDASLVPLGRGARLRAPIRLEVSVGGKAIPAVAAKPAQVEKETPGQVSYESELKSDQLSATLRSAYGQDGAMEFDIQWKIAQPVTSVEIVLDFQGSVTHLYRGLRSDFRPDAVDRTDLDVLLPSRADSVVWDNLKPWPTDKKNALTYLYVGSLDSGFSWLADEWHIADPAKPAMAVRRDKAGDASLHIMLQNAPADTAKGRHTFALITHPSKPRPQGFRRTQWLSWGNLQDAKPVTDGIENITLKYWQKVRGQAGETAHQRVAGGFSGAALEAAVGGIEMTGFAGAFAISAEKDNARLYPNSLFAVMAAPYTGLPARVQSNMRKLASAGEAPAYDRQFLGRALIHDIGVGIQGIKQPFQYVRLANALQQFGFFDTDEIEVLPYWRNSGIIRYGEEWAADDAFAVEEKNPSSGVYVTAYRKPIEQGGKKGYAALIALMNENDHPVRERLFILAPQKLFGGPNQLTALNVFGTYRFDALPKDSAWLGAENAYVSFYRGRASEAGANWMKGAPIVLRDVEDNSFAELFASKQPPPPEIYGRLYISARDYRLLYGQWLHE